jgi:hypothetical protein
MSGFPSKSKPWHSCCGEGVTSEKMANSIMVHLSQSVRHHAKGCTALGWNLTSVIDDPLMTQGSTLLYSCLPPIWGARSDDLLHPLYSWDCIQIPRKRKQVIKTLKKKIGIPF